MLRSLQVVLVTGFYKHFFPTGLTTVILFSRGLVFPSRIMLDTFC